MLRGPILVIALFLALLNALPAQEVAFIDIGRIESSVLSRAQLDTLERMVASYVSETESWGSRLIPAGEADSPPGEGTILRISGSITNEGEGLVFRLEGRKPGIGDIEAVSEICPSVNDVILQARELTYRLLEGSVMESPLLPAELPPLPAVENDLSLSTLTGTWKGDYGLDKVRVYESGKAVASLSNGVTMTLSISLESENIVFLQDEASTWRFYQSASWSMATAREIAAKARPMRWVMALSSDGRKLSGIKESVAVSRGSDGKLLVDNDYSRKALWERLY